MNFYRTFLRPLLFRFDAERIHDRAIRAGRRVGSIATCRKALSAWYGFSDPRLETEVGGLRLANPIGLAAGFDKNGRAVGGLGGLGFGHLEIGSVSADASAGNALPRLWRLPIDRALVVHYGLPNEGAEVIARRLERRPRTVPLGVNVVKTNRGITAPPESDDAIIADYVRSVRILRDTGDYLSLNLSCPNTETGCNFFADPTHVARLLEALSDLDLRCPVFLKVSPQGGARALDALLEAVDPFAFVTGFAFNLAPGKPPGLNTPARVLETMPGATSGKPIERQMNEAIGALYRRMDRRRYRIIGIGGVFSAEDAYRKIRLGASMVQLLTGLIYEGPGLVRRIKQGLCRLLERDGVANVSEAVGVDSGR